MTSSRIKIATPKSFRTEIDSDRGVATFTFDRPDKLNALTFEVYAELAAAFAQIGQVASVRAVVLTGAGRAFCSGGDVNDIIGPLLGRDYAPLLEFTRMTCALVRAIRQCPRPVIAALNGTVAGAGAVIAAACDIRLAAPSAKIAFLFAKVGLSGADMGISWLLPRIVGLGRATELLMTGDFIDAAEAHRIGLYNRIVPAESLMDESIALARRLAQGPRLALEITKDALNREASMDLWGALEHEAQIQAVCMQHPNFGEAHEAFVAKRPPRFE